MKRKLMIALGVLAVAAGLLMWRQQVRSREEAELWAAATDDLG